MCSAAAYVHLLNHKTRCANVFDLCSVAFNMRAMCSLSHHQMRMKWLSHRRTADIALMIVQTLQFLYRVSASFDFITTTIHVTSDRTPNVIMTSFSIAIEEKKNKTKKRDPIVLLYAVLLMMRQINLMKFIERNRRKENPYETAKCIRGDAAFEDFATHE